MDTLSRLEQIIAQRRDADPSQSYVASLHAKGLPQIARKLGEEGVEATIATLSGSDEELVGEAADMLFHLILALNARHIPFADVLAELERREGTSGIEEKASRSE
ncbi:phosphoribosyl-ATP diphosphatase [Qipengyuania qiaonensis]|uniref:Phosphoribosyl-ATP pyrophosphatase n=1 Tax=Qipengyuania qiaonensis TaxID=2867240 RepID=A0ABS7J676_9SPHN|nr:phosphoribosyl-ATP diphosphatase [Qipengyuania qiaonensis]MBX7482829.1 phosphoribosyl-ATP diphosphatase [Qipengyuania qiaonensis]